MSPSKLNKHLVFPPQPVAAVQEVPAAEETTIRSIPAVLTARSKLARNVHNNLCGLSPPSPSWYQGFPSIYGFTFCRLRPCAVISLALPFHNTERAAWYTSLMLER